MTQSIDPYAAPKARDLGEPDEGYSEINLFSARGRLGRLRYFAYVWVGSMLLNVAVSAMGAFMGMSQGAEETQASSVMYLIMGLMVVLFIPFVVLTIIWMIQRLHDLNRSGWMGLLLLVPLVNIIWGLYLALAPGTPGRNDYGLPPPPNSRGVVVFAWLAVGLVVLGIVAAIAIPMMMVGASIPAVSPG